MKKSSIILLALISLPTYAADDMLKALLENTASIPSTSTKANEESKEVGKTETKSLVTGKTCLDLNIDEQKSLPLKVIAGLIQQEPRDLKFRHMAKDGKLEITSPPMIGNCNDMIEWKVSQTSLNGENAYSVEAKIKDGSSCIDGKCAYKMWKKESEDSASFKPVVKSFAPNFSGFKACLAESGVFKKGSASAVKDLMYLDNVNVKANGIKDGGKVVFVSEGPDSSQIGALHGDFDVVSDCRYYEDVADESLTLVSYAQILKEERDRQAAELEKCTVNDYQKIADFLDAYEQDYAYLRPILNDLLETAAKDSVKRFAEGKDTAADFELMEDFKKLVVDPLIEKANRLYAEAEELDGEERERKLAQLQSVLAQIKSYSEDPYFVQGLTDKFLKDGRFEAAGKMNSLRLVLEMYPKLGTEVNGETLTTENLSYVIAEKQEEYADALEEEQELYEIRTGQNFDNMKRLNQELRNAQVTLQNRITSAQDDIRDAQSDIQSRCPLLGSYYQYCVKHAMADIEDAQYRIQMSQKAYQKFVENITPDIEKYRALEAQGREYLKSKGEEAPAEEVVSANPAVNMNPSMQNPGLMNPSMGQMPQQPYMGASAMNPYMMQGPSGMFMGQQNPYAMSGYQQPFMGQTGMYSQFGLQAGMGGQQYGMMNPYGMGGMNQNYGMLNPLGQYYSGMGMQGMQMPQMGGGYMNYGMGMGMGMGQQPMMGQPAMYYPGSPTF